MKAFTAIAICASLLFVVSISFSQSDEICCTWVNEKYQTDEQPNKIIFNYDGTFASYRGVKARDPVMRGIFRVDEKWQDSEGIIWYRLKLTNIYGTEFYLARVSKEGQKLELVHKPYEYPKSVEVDTSNYCTYTRFIIE